MGLGGVWLCEWIILDDEIKIKMMRKKERMVKEGKKIEID